MYSNKTKVFETNQQMKEEKLYLFVFKTEEKLYFFIYFCLMKKQKKT